MLYALAAATGSRARLRGAEPAGPAAQPGAASQLPARHGRLVLHRCSSCASIGGPSLGGLLYGAGPGLAYTACAAVLPRGRQLQRPPAGPGATSHRPAAGHARLVLRRRRLRPPAGRTSSAPSRWTCSPSCWAAPPRCCRSSRRDVLHAGPIGLGVLRAAPGAGALCVSLTLVQTAALAPPRPGHVRSGRPVRRRHHRVRLVAPPCRLGRRPGHAGRGGRGQRRHPLHPGADAHARTACAGASPR